MATNEFLKRMRYRTACYFKRYSSTLLTFIGAVGVVGTAVMAAKAAPKALKLLESAEKQKGEELTALEKVQTAGPVYIPTVTIGASTIACIFGANVLSRRNQAALTSAYALIDRSYKEYRKTLINLHGEEADIEVRNAMAREHCNFHQLRLDVPDGKAIFYEEISGQSIVCYEREIMDAEYHMNRNYAIRGYALLNELYEFLGLPATEYGGIAGWSMASGLSWIDFEHRMIDNDDGGTACYSIDMVFPPEILEEWEC